MKKKFRNATRDDYMATGFALLMPGILLASILRGNIIIQIIGIILLILASASFGASFRTKK